MSCTPQELATAAKCLMQLSPRQSLAAWAYALCQGVTPPTGDRFVTEDGDPLVTEPGDQLIPE